MKNFEIKSVTVTMVYMSRDNLITKEEMEKYCKGFRDVKDSVYDDIESFFEDLRLGNEPDEDVSTYFLPGLTNEEMELVERKDSSYLQTFFVGFMNKNPDVEEAEMKLSESKLKFVRGWCNRRTFTIEFTNNLRKRKRSSDELIYRCII